MNWRMRMNYLSEKQQAVLNELIDKYEGKKGYGKSSQQSKGTILDVKKYFKEYMHPSDSSHKKAINTEILELEREGFVQIVWEKNNYGEYIEKVYLTGEEQHLNLIYGLLNRTPKFEKYQKLKALIKNYLSKAPVELVDYYENILSKVEELEYIGGIIDPDDLKATEDGLLGLNELVKLKNFNEEIRKRNWSVKLFADSKRWEELEKKILAVIKEYVVSIDDSELEDIELLAQFGVIPNVKRIEIKGKILMKNKKGEVYFDVDEYGIALSPPFFLDAEIISMDVNKIITIENLTTFYSYLEKNQAEDELVIFLGGFHNSIRTTILKKIKHFIKKNGIECTFFHWGDIDLGGFRILFNLRNSIDVDVIPFKMDVETYLANEGNGKLIQKQTYLIQLEKALKNKDFQEFHDVITLMIQRKKTIEQESIQI
jgi:hypothetical protein